jgi:phosphoglycerate dehydrogenase-like enzyme
MRPHIPPRHISGFVLQKTVKPILHLLAGLSLVNISYGQVVLLPSGMKKDAEAVALANPSLKPVFYDDAKDALEKIPNAEAYIGGPNGALMTAGVKLRWVHIFSAGIEDYRDLPGFADGRVTMTSLKIYQGPEIADHAFALLLHLTRNIGAYQQAQAEAEWTKTSKPVMPLTELRGRTMLVIGYGGIGTQVAERAKAFGMTVNAIDLKDIPLTVTLQKTGKPDELQTMLPEADVVVNCLPITPATENMIGPGEFAKMKQGTYFINVSRGKVVNTAALVQALQEKRLAGAGLDVVDPEPLPKDSPLWKMPNVIITPHIAGVSDARTGRQNALIIGNLTRFAHDLPLKNVVDPVKGF